MTEFYTEFDEIQAALAKVPLNENVMPYVNGRLVENVDEYNKIQKLLACNEMEQAHQFLYDLDVENLDNEDCEKIDKLFDMGVKRGYIDNSFEEEFQREQNPQAIVPAEEPVTVDTVRTSFKAPIPCWTVLYSATKNGETKCGESYSNAVSVQAAKADAMAKLARFGYENVSVLAIEAGDPDACDCGSGCCCNETDIEEDDVEENDMIRGRVHNRHMSEALTPYKVDDASLEDTDFEADNRFQVTGVFNCNNGTLTDTFETSIDAGSIDELVEKVRDFIDGKCRYGDAVIEEFTLVEQNGDDFTDEANEKLMQFGESDMMSEEEFFEPVQEAGKNPYIAGMKTVTGGKIAAPKAKKVCEDDEDTSDDASDDTSSEDTSSDDTAAEDTSADNSSADDTSDDTASEDTEDTSDDTASEDSEDTSDDTSSEETSDEGSDEGSDEETSDEGSDEESDEDSDDEGSDDSEDGEELDDEKKAVLKDEYRRVFKSVMLKCGFEDKAFNDLTIEQKVKFFETLNTTWKKNEPSEFMTDKEQDQLEAIVTQA